RKVFVGPGHRGAILVVIPVALLKRPSLHTGTGDRVTVKGQDPSMLVDLSTTVYWQTGLVCHLNALAWFTCSPAWMEHAYLAPACGREAPKSFPILQSDVYLNVLEQPSKCIVSANISETQCVSACMPVQTTRNATWRTRGDSWKFL
uniref:Uncharacterized protein n=1 Tax=Salvator merianae TaxID=96440 RepID=A0A8D0E660_SALMN